MIICVYIYVDTWAHAYIYTISQYKHKIYIIVKCIVIFLSIWALMIYPKMFMLISILKSAYMYTCVYACTCIYTIIHMSRVFMVKLHSHKYLVLKYNLNL